MGKSKTGSAFLESLTPVSLTAEQQLAAELTDSGDVMGVAWSPKYRAWRAYLHVGQKQVHHSLHETKASAIEARKAAEVRFGSSTMTMEQVSEWYPKASFRRHHRAPKVAVRKKALLSAGRVMRDVSSLVNRAAKVWPEDKTGRRRSPMTRDEERSFARRLGQVLAIAEYLRMTGDVRVEEIEAGMREEVGRILRYQV